MKFIKYTPKVMYVNAKNVFPSFFLLNVISKINTTLPTMADLLYIVFNGPIIELYPSSAI